MIQIHTNKKNLKTKCQFRPRMAYLVFPTFNYSFISILILFWNVIGSGGDYFTRSMRDLIKTYDQVLVVLIETRISGADAERQIQGIGFWSRTSALDTKSNQISDNRSNAFSGIVAPDRNAAS